jgi:hypothetical protein
MSSALFLAQAAHTSSVSHSQFDKHFDNALNFPAASPYCVSIMSPKQIHAFCGQWPLCPWAEYNHYNSLLPSVCSEVPLTHMILFDIAILISQCPSCDRVLLIGIYLISELATVHVFLIEFWGTDLRRTGHIYFSTANKMSMPTEQQKP